MINKIISYKELIVWQKSIDLVVEIYKITSLFPKSELFGLVSQMRRSVVSIPSNIAEGRSRGSRIEYRKFLIIAYSSAAELETQILISKKLFGINLDKYKYLDNLLEQVIKMLNKSIQSLKPITYNL